MGSVPGSLKLVKAGFVLLDATGAATKIIVFQYNPETLVRRLDAGAISVAGAGGVGTAAHAEGAPTATPAVSVPRETVAFTLSLDAADKLERGDPVTQQTGLLPMISALELLLYPPAGSLTVWVSGSRRILPVQLNELVFNEQAFDPLLNPIRADVAVQLQVLKDADLPANSRGRVIWDEHYVVLQQLAKTLDAGTLSALGIGGI